VVARLAPSYERGLLTNGPLVRQLEEEVAARLGVAHAVAVASCTSGLMLALRVLEVSGPVVMPSFTFSASAHAVAWNGCAPVFAECDADTFQLDLEDAAARVPGATALLATHVFGAPCRPEAVEELAAGAGIPVVFDAAHAFGATRRGRPVGGFGAVEVFSLTPTKPLVAGEGGLVTTDRADVADAVRIGRDYGNPGDYDTRFVGLNARLSELHAAVALESLRVLDAHLARRRELAARYVEGLRDVPGLRVQRVDPDDVSTYKDFTLHVDAEGFGTGRDVLAAALRAEGVDTRAYFDPPVHRQRSHATTPPVALRVTEAVAASVLSLPLYPSLSLDDLDAVVEVVRAVGEQAPLLGPPEAPGSTC
jgi:dTDP-4-amino-4,6-dideoxygalactose transaminase